ncbi:MAG: copper resistance protein CopC/CopD [Armatimonadetes bacterium]|nr:copper resistance protein CopC/CopD [Armatimonadota bacterium]
MNLRGHASILRAVAVAALLTAAAISPAAAHGILERSDPAANASVPAAPKRLVLWFTEPVDPVLSSASVLDGQGRRVSGRAVVGEDRRSMRVEVDAEAAGLYTITWQVLSTVDGHVTRGAFVFAVGRPAPDAASSQTAPPDPLAVAARWGAFYAAILLAGSIFFQLLVLRPTERRAGVPAGTAGRGTATGVLRRLQVAASLVLIATVTAEFALTAASLIEASLPQAVARGLLWPLLFGTKAGWSALARWGLAMLLLLPPGRTGRVVQSAGLLLMIGTAGLAAIFRSLTALASPTHTLHLILVVGVSLGYGLVNAIRRPPEVDWVPALAAAGLLAGFTLTSHAFGSGPAAIIADWTHLLAAAAWVGGLVALFVVVRTRGAAAGSATHSAASALTPILVSRFSMAAALSLGILVLTGLYGMWLHVPGLAALTGTPYGRALGLKLLLVLALAALGTMNHFVFRPRLAAATGGARPPGHRRFLRAVTGEIGVGAAILLVVAVLTITPPASVVAPSAAREPLRLAGLAGPAGDVRVRLAIAPAKPGWNVYEVDITSGGAPLSGATRALLRLTHLDVPLMPVTVRLLGRDGGRFTATGGELSLPGWWEVTVIVRRASRLDDATAFPLRLGVPPTRPSDPAALRLLDRARRTAGTLRAWRQVEELTDGRGNVVVTTFEFVAPDRMRYRTSGRQEAIIIGARRFTRSDGGPWEQDSLPDPLKVEGPALYMREAQAVTQGRLADCEGEPCRVLLWEAPGGSAAFAGWIGTRSGRVYRLLMVAASHFMTVRVRDFDAPIRITPP